MAIIHGLGHIGTGSAAVAPAVATKFAVSLGASSGNVGTTQAATVAPIGGVWPSGASVSLTASGVTCAVSPDTRVGSGTTPVTFSFTPSSAGTLTVDATAAGMTSTGTQTYVVSAVVVTPPPTPSANATRFDTIMDQSAVAPGATVSGGLYPGSGLWNGGSATLTPTTGAAITVALPNGGNAKVPFSFTPASAGEQALTSTNTGGLRNPIPAPLSVFAAAAGSSVALTIGTLPDTYRNQRTFQQHAWGGTAKGFSGVGGVTLANGWGRIRFPVSVASPVQGLFARMTDADSTGASSSGGGTVITNIAQVYGPTSGGNLALLLPASDYCVYLDLASDAAFTNPKRVPIAFFIRDVCLLVTRSSENMLWGAFANGIPGNLNWSSYTKTTGLGGQNPGNGGYETAPNNAWGRADGVQSFGQYGQTYGGVGGQELGRMFVAQKGTGLGILGLTPAGGDMDTFWLEDGTPCAGIVAMMNGADNEARYLAYQSAGWSGIYAPISAAEYQKVYAAISRKMFALYPSLGVISGNCNTGWFGPGGSGELQDGSCNDYVRQVELVDPSTTAVEAGADWNEYYSNSGHASWSSAIRYARARARAIFLSESQIAGGYGRGFADRYTMLAATGTLSNGVISIPFTLAPGATKVVALRWANYLTKASDWVYTTPSAADLCRLVAVYQGANQRYSSSSNSLVTPTGVTIDNAQKMLRIAVPTSTVGPLTVQFLVDFSLYSARDTSFCASFFDDRDLGDGCGYGPGLRQQLMIAIT